MDEEKCIPLELLLKYPLINVFKKGTKILYTGALHIQEHLYHIEVTEKKRQNKLEFNLKTNPELEAYTKKLAPLNRSNFTNIITYLDKIVEIVEFDGDKIKDDTNIYRKILQEYSEFTKFYLNLKSAELAYDMSAISVVTSDSAGREHAVGFKVNYSIKDLFSFKCYDLPCEKTKIFQEKSSSLIHLFDMFLNYLESLQQFLDLMDVIDSNSTVLDPIKPSKKDCFRRIWLENNVSVVITFDPYNITSNPKFVFLGPDSSVNVYRAKINENLERWDSNSGDILNEILILLGLLEFPKKMDTEGNCGELLSDDTDCCICYFSELNGKSPEIVCDNRTCQKLFHVECIYEWLLSINSKRVFNEIKGPCPNCSKIISCPLTP